MAKRESYGLKEIRVIPFVASKPPVFVINVFYGSDPLSYRIVQRVKAEEPHLTSEWDIYHTNGAQRMKPLHVMILTGDNMRSAYAHGLLHVMAMAETAHKERSTRITATEEKE